jgi:hypothetical protein
MGAHLHNWMIWQQAAFTRMALGRISSQAPPQQQARLRGPLMQLALVDAARTTGGRRCIGSQRCLRSNDYSCTGEALTTLTMSGLAWRRRPIPDPDTSKVLHQKGKLIDSRALPQGSGFRDDMRSMWGHRQHMSAGEGQQLQVSWSARAPHESSRSLMQLNRAYPPVAVCPGYRARCWA